MQCYPHMRTGFAQPQFKNRGKLQRSPLLCTPGLVKFVLAIARLFCMALPGSFLTMLAQNKGDLCTKSYELCISLYRTKKVHTTNSLIFQVSPPLLVGRGGEGHYFGLSRGRDHGSISHHRQGYGWEIPES